MKLIQPEAEARTCNQTGNPGVRHCLAGLGRFYLDGFRFMRTGKTLVINSLGKKWELTFTTLVLFGGALFAAFPLFYATSFGGAYWVWILILFTFILQAVSYEYRKKPSNILGARTYEIFLFINGSVGIILIGTAIGTFFTGSNFSLNDYNLVTWHSPLRGLEAAFNLFNLSFGLFLMFVSRILGALYLHNNIDQQNIRERTRKAAFNNLLFSLPFLLYILFSLVTMDGFAVAPRNGKIFLESGKYLQSSLTIANASSSHYTLTAMSYMAMSIPFILTYVMYVWHLLDARKLTEDDVSTEKY